MDRKSASAKTAATGIILNLIALVLGFIVQRIFLQTLGVEYTGINGTYGNIISILTLSDIGVSAATTFYLYSALAKGEKRRIAALMNFYKRACRAMAGIVLMGGLILLPFAGIFVGNVEITDNLYVIFGLSVVVASLQYAFNYRRILLIADQRGYLVNLVLIGCSTALYITKIIILLFTRNFYLYLIATIIEKLAENLIIGKVAKLRYELTKEKTDLDIATKTDMKKKMYASVYHNTVTYVVNFTDNAIIAQIFGVAIVGLCVNYYMIINALRVLIDQIFNSVVASLGNILAAEGHKKLYQVVKNIMFLNFWVYAVVCTATYFCLKPFIAMWIGPDYWLPEIVVMTIVLNMFIQSMRSTMHSVLSIGGIIYENRFVSVAEAIINLATSIILAKIIGLPGIFIGTIISNLFLHLYGYPKYAFKLVLKRKPIEYVRLFAKYLIIFIATWGMMRILLELIQVENIFAQFMINGFLCLVIPSFIYWLIFRKTTEYLYVIDLLKTFGQKMLVRLQK